MAVTPYTKVSSASIAGLVTDGNALMTTEQSNLDEANYELMRDGTRRRRRPIVQETDGELTFLGSSKGSQRSSYIWQTPAFRGNLSILCEENNEEIKFYRIDRDTPSFTRGPEFYDRLRLELWGNRSPDYDSDITGPSTYTEGNGSLYIFNPRAGTIKVELLKDDKLRMTAVGRWVRDYRGAAEEDELDYRKPRNASIFEYAPGKPFFLGSNEKVHITEELGIERAYNLSNSGWDAKAVSEFMIQSDKDYIVRDPSNAYVAAGASVTTSDMGLVGTLSKIDNPSLWPATTDRYLSGRQIDERGVDQFSFPQLVQAKDNKSMPPLGARICHSEYGPAGTLVGIPTELAGSTSIVVNGGGSSISVSVTFDNRQSHINSSVMNDRAVFIHSMSFTAVKDGRTYQGGVSGMYPGGNIFNDGKTIFFTYPNTNLTAYNTIQIVSLYAHPAPEYFPHRVPNNGNGYDYRIGGRNPLAGAFFAGRLWQTADNHNRLYFSQIVETSTGDSDKRGVCFESLCFMSADPTDGDDNAVVASDGGYINTSDSGTHYGLITLGDSLLLMTDRGIWAIRPGGKGSFTASDYQFTKVIGTEVLGPQAFISTGDQVHVATDEGILVLTMESTSFGNTSVVAQRALERRLQKGYEDIIAEFPSPTAAYDAENRTVRWLFRAKTDWDYEDGVGQPMLSYSFYHQAWYKYVLGADSRVFEILAMPYAAKTETYNKFRYLIGGPSTPTSNVYLTGWGVEVELGEEGLGLWVQNGLRSGELFADYRPLSHQLNIFRDPVPAYMLTNHMIPGEGIRWSQINYIVVYNRNVTETWRGIGNNDIRASVEGGTLLSVRWDWMDRHSTGKWSEPYQTYRYRRSYISTGITGPNDLGEPVLAHKMKLRGRGREFRLYFESDGHKDSHIEGWAYQGYILNGV